MSPAKIRVLIVDDSAAMRQLLTRILESDPLIEVVGTAPDPYFARDKIKALNPDVLTLDVEMPRMDGLTFLEKLMRAHPMPVVMVSSLTQRDCDVTLRALELGAVDFFPKPTLDTLTGVEDGAARIVAQVKAAARARVRPGPPATQVVQKPLQAYSSSSVGAPSFRQTYQIWAIGASTGGTEAVRAVLTALPADAPGVLVVLHMPPGFTGSYAQRLDSLCAMHVKEAEDGDRVLPGHVLLAPGLKQMSLVRSGANYTVRVVPGERVNRHCPSVDVLFHSCAQQAGRNATGVILTGMGDDGAAGLKAMRDAGAHTIAQDEATCVVFGMPKEAIAQGGVEHVLPLERIAARLLSPSALAA